MTTTELPPGHIKTRSTALSDDLFNQARTAYSERREDLLDRLVAWSLSDDGLDWDALAAVNITGWGTDPTDE